MATVPEGITLDVHIFVTQGDDYEKASEGSVDGGLDKKSPTLPFRVTHGRPDVTQILTDELSSATEDVSVGGAYDRQAPGEIH